MISLITAVSENNVIGKNNCLPWHLPADLKHFKQTTMGHVLIMGRKTFESIGKKPLPGRTSIVVTRQPDYDAGDCIAVNSLEQALRAAGEDTQPFIAGGADIYRQALPFAERIYLTRIHRHFEGDATFPTLDPVQWKEVSSQYHPSDEKNHYSFSFCIYKRKVL